MPIPNIYKFTLAAAYTLTAADNTEIAADRAANKKWANGYSGFKTRIRIFLKNAQRNRCAFCRTRVAVENSYSNLEHLVPKSLYDQFEFLPKNLVYSCTICNLGKKFKNTLTTPIANKASQTYPANAAGFNIVNPYFDNYEDHLDLLDDVIITVSNASAKGRKTIEFYGLDRISLAEGRAFEHQIDKADLNKRLVARLTDTTIDQAVMDQITAVIADLGNWVI